VLVGSFVNTALCTGALRMFKAYFTNNGTVTSNLFHSAVQSFKNNGTLSAPGDLSMLNSDTFEGETMLPRFTNSAGATFTTSGGGVLGSGTCSFTNAGTATNGGYIEIEKDAAFTTPQR
jgi:hypothetical protein